MKRIFACSVAGAAVLASATLASAGVIDSPLPNLGSSVATRHVYTVTGVMKNNNLETDFICTSLEPFNTIRVGVEVFTATGGNPMNDVSSGVGDGAQDVLPGTTVTIGTGNTLGIHEDEVISAAALPAGSLKNGSARILATSSKIICNAIVADDLSDPPTSMVPLKVFAKKKQSGD